MADNSASLLAKLDEIVERYKLKLNIQIALRRKEMEQDSIEHLQLYELLGFLPEEGRKIDLYQNIGRFVYKYAGGLIEEATIAVLQAAKTGKNLKILNTVSNSPKTFQIDFFSSDDNKAHEIKWRDATTDGDHIRKERDKLQCILKAGMIPVRVMYYMPNREQAIQIQNKVSTNYQAQGEAYVGKDAWSYMLDYANFDLYGYFEQKVKDLRV